MDRRRFVPSSEALDRRELLSGTGLFGQSSSSLTANGAQSTRFPDTFDQKLLRIHRVPFYLDNLQPGRFLPPATIESLQADMAAVAANLHTPHVTVRVQSSPLLKKFNLEERKIMPQASLSPQDAGILNQLFGAVLTKEGATTQEVENLKSDMNSIAKADSASPNPVFLVTNDYAILLQGVNIIGRPIQTPDKPLLAAKNGERLKIPGFGATTKTEPTLVGYYRVGAKIDPGTQMQVLDLQGNVLGSAPVILTGRFQGRYSLTLTQPLHTGVNWLRIRAIDAQGHTSDPSSVFSIKVVVPR